MKTKRRKHKIKIEFTKILVITIILITSRWIELTYKLAQQGKEQIAENLSMTIASVILGTIITYALKSYGEKNSKNKYNIEEE